MVRRANERFAKKASMRIIYGINPVVEALKMNARNVERVAVSEMRGDKQIGAVIKAAESAGVRVEALQMRRLDEAAGTPGHQGVVAFLKSPYPYRSFEELIRRWKGSKEPALILILDSIQDPQNLGALVRCAVSAGAHGIIIPKDRACEVTPAVVKASAGATEHAYIAREVNLTRVITELKAEGIWVAGLAVGSKETIYEADFKRDIALAIGGEGTGLRRLVREACDYCVSIPMYGGFDSLNASTAGAVTLFEARRQRRG